MTFKEFIGSGTTGIIGVLNTIIVPTIFALAFAVFVWGTARYFIFHGGDEKKREDGRPFVLWGIIGMVVLFSVWGLVNMLLATLNITP